MDLTTLQENANWAVYLPAISTFYVQQLSKLDGDPMHAGRAMPAKFELGHQGLDFLSNNSYYKYKWGLYSAGHAELDLTKANVKDAMVQNRDRDNTIILGDSGGFQIATGVLKMDWSKVLTPACDPIREKILRWLEHTADWSMTLDVPPFASRGKASQKTGLKTLEDCHNATVVNLAYFVRNRIPGKTKFLNVLSGVAEGDAQTWFNKVIPFSQPNQVAAMGLPESHTLEGYAFAGVNARQLFSTLNRVLDLRELDLLKDKDWIHVLGVGRMDVACYMTSLMKALRKWDNPNITISFDAASPFVSVAYGLAYTGTICDGERFSYSMDKAIDSKLLKGSKLAMPWISPIMDRLTAGDICVMGDKDTNKHGKTGRTSWDTFSYCLYMGHNVFKHISAVQEANKHADIAKFDAHDAFHYSNWAKKLPNISQHIPDTILYFDSFINELLDPATADPRQLLLDNKKFLDALSFSSMHDEKLNHDTLTAHFGDTI